MTKEEAKLVLDNARPQTKEIDRQFYDDEDLNNALDMAIKALEQQPSDDCVSRKDIYFKLTNGAYHNETIEQFIDRLVKELEALPPVTPTRKSGLHWIERFNNEDKWLECPYCHKDSDNAYNYCPNCGAEMESEEDGND